MADEANTTGTTEGGSGAGGGAAVAPAATPSAAPTPQTSAGESNAPAASGAAPAAGSETAPGGEGKPAAQTPAEATVNAAEGRDETNFVRWDDHRKVRTERNRLRAENQRYQQELETMRSQAPTGGSVPPDVARVVENHQQLSALLRANPDILEALNARAGASGRPIAPAGAPRGGEEVPPWAKPMMERLDELHGSWSENRSRSQQAAEREQWQQRDQQVDSTVRTWLAGKQLADDIYFEDAKQYIYAEALKMRDAEMEDIPRLLGQWHRRENLKDQHRRRSYVADKQADARMLPASSPAGSAAPVQPRTDFGANDSTTAQKLAQGLKQLGWGQ